MQTEDADLHISLVPGISGQHGCSVDVALGYIRRGWNPVPLPFKKKRPLTRDWQNRIIDETTVAHFFNSTNQNIGVQLGPTSHGLTDVDLDCPEAISLAAYVLPRTGAIFGRTSKPGSHWLYTTDLSIECDTAVVQFKGPDDTMLLELRIGGGGKGAQTVFPGSTHESGETISWETNKDGDPAEVNGKYLTRCAKTLAAATLIARTWPAEGGRHAPGDARRDRAFLIVVVGGNVGAFLAPLVSATLGEAMGWRYSFASAGVGMLIALVVYLAALPTLPIDELHKAKAADVKKKPLGPNERRAVLALIMLFLPVTLFWATFEQQGNTLVLWSADQTDRTVNLLFWSGEIPVTFSRR
jgi:Bifunctional DNA primase/polymerase, N-terminal/Major Facilitator Superfamily